MDEERKYNTLPLGWVHYCPLLFFTYMIKATQQWEWRWKWKVNRRAECLHPWVGLVRAHGRIWSQPARPPSSSPPPPVPAVSRACHGHLLTSPHLPLSPPPHTSPLILLLILIPAPLPNPILHPPSTEEHLFIPSLHRWQRLWWWQKVLPVHVLPMEGKPSGKWNK